MQIGLPSPRASVNSMDKPSPIPRMSVLTPRTPGARASVSSAPRRTMILGSNAASRRCSARVRVSASPRLSSRSSFGRPSVNTLKEAWGSVSNYVKGEKKEKTHTIDEDVEGFGAYDDDKKSSFMTKICKSAPYMVFAVIIGVLICAWWAGLLVSEEEDAGSFADDKPPVFDRVYAPISQPEKYHKYQYADEVWEDNKQKMAEFKVEGGFHKFYIPKGSPMIWSCDCCKKRGMLEGEPAFGNFKYNVGCCGECYERLTGFKFGTISSPPPSDEFKVRRPLLDIYKERRDKKREL